MRARSSLFATSILLGCSPEGAPGGHQRNAAVEKPAAGEVVSLVSASPDARSRNALLAAASAAASNAPPAPSAAFALGEAALSAFAHPVELPPAATSSASAPAALTMGSFRHIVRSTESIEVALRKTVYFDMVTRCKNAQGAVLPPEAIGIAFQLDERGVLVPSSIRTRVAKPGPGHAEAADCMARVLAASGFRVPTSTEGDVTDVETLVPSID